MRLARVITICTIAAVLLAPTAAGATPDAPGDAGSASSDLTSVWATGGSTDIAVTVESAGPSDIANDPAWSNAGTELDVLFDTDDDGTADEVAAVTYDAGGGVVRAPVRRLSDGAHLCDMTDSGGWDDTNATKLGLRTTWSCLGSTRVRVGARFQYAPVGAAATLDVVPLGEPFSPSSMMGPGYPNSVWMVSADGGVFSFGLARFHGSAGGTHLNKPIVGMAATPTGMGYWLVASDGGIFSYGDAGFYGSTGSMTLNKPVVGMAATPTGRGYWLVASDGGIFSYGDARFYGSTGAMTLNKPVVGMAATVTGRGYWFVASDGGIFSYGDATFRGSAGALRLNAPIVGMAASTTGGGYWMVGSDGGIFTYGDAGYCTGQPMGHGTPTVAVTASTGSVGYEVVRSDGSYSSPCGGSSGISLPLNQPIVGAAGVPRTR